VPQRIPRLRGALDSRSQALLRFKLSQDRLQAGRLGFDWFVDLKSRSQMFI